MMFTHLLSFFLIGTCSIYAVIAYGNVNYFSEELVQPLDFHQALEKFNNDLYKNAASNGSIQNVLLSPLSINILLAILAVGAAGRTRSEIVTGINQPLQSGAQILNNYKLMVENLMNVTDVELQMSNAIFVDHSIRLKKSFQDELFNYFKAHEFSVNFKTPIPTVDKINGKISEQTNNKINNMLSTKDIDERSTKVVITNAIYFKGEWKYKFANVTNLVFHDYHGQTKIVPTMTKTGPYRVSFGDTAIKARMIELPYKGDELSMLIVIPYEMNGLDDVESSLERVNLRNHIKSLMPFEVKLNLPKFRVEATTDLYDALNKMGINEAFTDIANFSRITDGNLSVSKMMHKTLIEVNENGAEAAAASVAVLGFRSMKSDPPEFNANHPFHYKIIKSIDKNNHVVLFAGNVKHIQ
ncbi:antichymotrypsin-2-like [Leptopilina boulardi]|uniref:Venom serpin n=1 Tax=Leptopilina boulardi TaxID=63433 RepID=C8YIV6_9HYME|nr:antichymotrypsin-2-like [Leptopilina boulardi]ACQ83466.1 venom serpin precursor [Leptopilina boulardi]